MAGYDGRGGIHLLEVPPLEGAVIIAAGPLTLMPGERPSRLVIRLKRTTGPAREPYFVLCNQFFPLYPRLDKYEFGDGVEFYAQNGGWPAATDKFGYTLERRAQVCKADLAGREVKGGEDTRIPPERVAEKREDVPHNPKGRRGAWP